MMFLGIDPGKKGSLALVDDQRIVVSHNPTPVIKMKKTEYNLPEMKNLLMRYRSYGHIELCILEKQQAMPLCGTFKNGVRQIARQGASQLVSVGLGYGLWLMALTCLGIPFVEVAPITWTKRMFRGITGEGKGRNYKAARQLFPEWQPKFKYEQEYADSLLLAEYGRLIR